MPRIFDNMQHNLLPELRDTLDGAIRADFCVGYVNLRGWRSLEDKIEQFAGTDDAQCRLLVGMQTLDKDELQTLLSLKNGVTGIDREKANLLKRKCIQEFYAQLAMSVPTNQDEKALRRLSAQLKAGKVTIKLFLRHRLHAKLYLIYLPEKTPRMGFLGSSNLTMSGLFSQGELNIDVNDHVATATLEEWFEDKWNDNFCLDISADLAEVIDNSWAGDKLVPPYHIYLKMAYHLSQEARAGIAEYRLPKELRDRLLPFQAIAVQTAAQKVAKYGGVMIADVVGLGKTLVGTALIRLLEDELPTALIICPKNLVSMWEDYRIEYGLRATTVMSISDVLKKLPDLVRYRVVLIDESHNLRNPKGKRYRAIQDYIDRNSSKCILLSATPYNKNYLDLSAQFQLFISETQNLKVRPEKYIRSIGEAEFGKRHQVPMRSIKAFEFSEYADDWRDLTGLFMIRRTRSFIKNNHTEEPDEHGRRYLVFPDGTRSPFPDRILKTAKFGSKSGDPYALLYSDRVVDVINALNLPRYGLGIFEIEKPIKTPTDREQQILDGLSRAGRRLMGFCRTNLFKRLESSGFAFLQSLDRHVLRNYVYLHAIANDLDIPIGTQDSALLDMRDADEDIDSLALTNFDLELEEDASTDVEEESRTDEHAENNFRDRAAAVYQLYATKYKKRFKWIRPNLFKPELQEALLADALALIKILSLCPEWESGSDRKLETLINLLTVEHGDRKVLIFTQFADTAKYLGEKLTQFGIKDLAIVTGSTKNPTEIAYQFSPKSNKKQDKILKNQELRILIATDILSEGQNLQDCHIIVNYDLPWAIIRLIQRAGRIDRIGQASEQILCYSFLPADGVEKLINLRGRLRKRLHENAEVVGTDEKFFEGDDDQVVRDLYNEKSGLIDDDDDNEVDLTSEALQIWKNATDNNPELKKTIEKLENVSFSTRSHIPEPTKPEGVLLYLRTAEGNDVLAYVDRDGKSVTESQLAILRLAACEPDTPAIEHDDQHFGLVAAGTEMIASEERTMGGQFGSSKGAKMRTYERLKRYVENYPLLVPADLPQAISELYRYPLRQSAIDVLNRCFKEGISDRQLVDLVLERRLNDLLCIISEDGQNSEPQIICSLGLFDK